MKKVIIVIMALCFALSGLSGVANAYMRGFEAEAGPLGADSVTGVFTSGPFGPRPDATASAGLYIGTEDGDGDSNGTPAAPNDGMAVYSFSAPAGTYRIIGRVRRPGSDSFWVRIVDSGGNSVDDSVGNNSNAPDWIRWNSIRGTTGGNWGWDVVHSNDDGNTEASFVLPADGNYQVQITRREDGTHLDGFVITDDLTLDENAMPDKIPYSELWTPENPSPADGAAGVALSGTKLTWDAPSTYAPPQAITRYDVYFGASEAAGDPNDNTFLIASVPGDGVLEADLDTLHGALTNDTTYYWRVDAVIDAEPNRLTAVGYRWSFDSIKYKPIITAQPADAGAWAGETVVFAVEATSGDLDDRGALSYQWHNSGGEIAGGTSSELVIANVQDANADDYYCVVSNADGDRISASAKLIIKHLLGHWPFDDDPNDVSGNGWLLTPSGNPQFVGTGVINGAASLDGSGDFFSSAAFALSLNGNEALSVSMWIKSNRIGTDRGFLAFADPSGNDQRGIRYDNAGASSGGDDVLKYGVAGSNGQQQELETPSNMQVTEWQHIVLTWVGTGEDIKFYINARVIPPQNSDGQATGGLEGYTNMHIGRGGKDDNAETEGWDGLIDDVRIYDYALDTLEIAVLYTDVMTDDSICLGGDPLDLDGDCRIGVSDLALFVAEYLDCNIVPDCKP